MFAPYTLDEAYHKALEIEKLGKLYPVRRTPSSRPPVQALPKMSESSVSASASKSHSSQTSPRVNPPATVTPGTSRNSGNNVRCFSCRGRGHYAFECLYRTLVIEHESHEPLELEEEVVDLRGFLKILLILKIVFSMMHILEFLDVC